LAIPGSRESSEVHMRGLEWRNPPGYAGPCILRVREAALSFNLSSLLSYRRQGYPLDLEELRISGVLACFERCGGRLNLEEALRLSREQAAALQSSVASPPPNLNATGNLSPTSPLGSSSPATLLGGMDPASFLVDQEPSSMEGPSSEDLLASPDASSSNGDRLEFLRRRRNELKKARAQRKQQQLAKQANYEVWQEALLDGVTIQRIYLIDVALFLEQMLSPTSVTPLRKQKPIKVEVRRNSGEARLG